MKKFRRVLTAAVFVAVVALSAPGAWAALSPQDIAVDAMAAYSAGDYERAVRLFTQAAEQGEVNSQRNLGLMYMQGKEAPQDYDKAAYWLRKAAEQGNADAQYRLSSLYNDGLGVPEDIEQALYWIRKAAAQGHAESQNVLQSYNENVARDEAIKICTEGVAAFEAKNYARAFELFSQAAEMGQADAQCNLGMLYITEGTGIKHDDEKAVYWLRKAAVQGNEEARQLLRDNGVSW
jgi:TPR repeat protein